MEQPMLYRYETVDSTNTVCKTLAQQGAEDGTAVIAARQTAGRGRMGRGFESPAGLGLYLSMLWRPVASPEGLLPLTAMVSASAALAIRRVTGADVRIKWPNDLVLNGKKLVGILTEVSLADGGVDYVVVGRKISLRRWRRSPPRWRRRATMWSGKRWKRHWWTRCGRHSVTCVPRRPIWTITGSCA